MAKARSSKANTNKQSKTTRKTDESTASRKAGAKKSATKSKSTAAKTSNKKAAAKKATTKKRTAKKAATKKQSTKQASSRQSASTKKATAKKTGAKKTGTKKTGPTKKQSTKKTETKKAGAKKAGTTKGGARRAKTPMDRKQLAHFRELLLEKRAELVGDLSGMEDSALRYDQSNLSTMPQHMADMGSDSYEQDLTLGLMESERELLAEIDEALERIEAGTFGVCVDTGKPINKARLEVKPWAKYSIEAARQHEGPNHA